MRRLGLSFLAVMCVVAFAQVAVAKGAKKAKKEKSQGPAPIANQAAISEFKGQYTWGMTPKQVLEVINAKITEQYKEKLADAAKDPIKADRVRKDTKRDQDQIAKSLVKFDGAKSGWDVSIIDHEFLQNNGESMLVYKEPKLTRYFFFNGDSLYKMFMAYDKDVLAGKNFQQFGEIMQGKCGKAQSVFGERQIAPGVKEKFLESYLWRSEHGDGLRLVDRSAFYDVFCLVIYDNAIAQRQDEIRKSRNADHNQASIVDQAMTDKPSDRDENDNVIDRITGKEVLKPGDRRGGNQNIVVPSPTGK